MTAGNADNALQGAQMLELIDGFGKTRAVMTKAAPTDLGQCAPGRHCAHHGSDPFFCCRCGAEFRPCHLDVVR